MLISNGLGTPHDAWPTINRQTETYRVVTWDHRGLGGSDRPADESRITISDHTDDLFAVMDSYGIDRAVVIGWSAGVNIAFEAALRDQRRIAGVLAIGGVPGATFEALLHPLPRFLRPRAGRVGSHLMRYLGPVLNRLGDGLPGSPEHGFDPRGLSTFGLDVIHGQTLLRVLRRFADHDWPWYSRLARAVGDHPEIDLSGIDMPVTYIAGTWDSITSAERMRAASARTPGSRYVELPATHLCRCNFPTGCQRSSAASLIAVASSLTKSDIRRIVRCPIAIRCEIAAVHTEQRTLLLLGEPGVHAQCGFRCIVVGVVRLRHQASLCEQGFGRNVECLGDRLEHAGRGLGQPALDLAEIRVGHRSHRGQRRAATDLPSAAARG